jgi:hypothetical protein
MQDSAAGRREIHCVPALNLNGIDPHIAFPSTSLFRNKAGRMAFPLELLLASIPPA